MERHIVPTDQPVWRHHAALDDEIPRAGTPYVAGHVHHVHVPDVSMRLLSYIVELLGEFATTVVVDHYVMIHWMIYAGYLSADPRHSVDYG